MIKKTITFSTYDEPPKTVSQDFYFNFTKADLIELEVSEKNGIADMMRQLIKEKDNQKIVAIFKRVVLMAYGKKAPDGIHFYKKDDSGRPFYLDLEASPAYSELFMELAEDAKAGAAFFNGVIPSDMAREPEELQKQIDEAVAEAQLGDTQSPIVQTGEPVLDNSYDGPLPSSMTEAAGVSDVVSGEASDVVDKTWADYTREELLALSDEEFFTLVGTTDPMKMNHAQLQVAMQRKSAGV